MNHLKLRSTYILSCIALSALIFLGLPQDILANCSPLLKEARVSLKKGDIQIAKSLYINAALCYENENDRENWFQSIWEINGALRNSPLYGYGVAASFLDSVLAVDWERETQTEEDYWMYTHLQNGINHKRDGDFQKSLDYYQDALGLILRDCKNGPWVRCYYAPTIWRYAIASMHGIYQELGDHETNLELLNQELLDSLVSQNDPQEGNVLARFYLLKGNSLYGTGTKENVKLAREAYLSALEVPHTSPTLRAPILLNLGRLNASIDQLDEAYKLMEGKKDLKHLQSKSLLYKAYIFRDQGKLNFAIQYAHKAISELQHQYSYEFHPEYGNSYLVLGELYEKQDSLEKALFYYHKCLKTVCQSFIGEDKSSLPKEEELVADTDLIDALRGKARIWSLMGQQMKNNSLLSRAVLAYKMALITEDKLINSSIGQDSRRRSLVRREKIAAPAIQTLHTWWKVNPIDSILDYTFFFMEKSRSQELLALVSEQRTYSHFPEAFQNTWEKLRIAKYSLVNWEKNLDSISHSSLVRKEIMDTLRYKIESQKSEILRLELLLRKHAPSDFNRTYLKKSTELHTFSDRLLDTQLYLSFFEGDTDVFVLGVNHDTTLFYKTPKDAHLLRKLNFFDDFLKNPTPNDSQNLEFQYVAFSLYQKLLQPISTIPNIRELVISAYTSLLGTLPFEAFLVTEKKAKDYRNLDFLWRKYMISYAYSANLYLFPPQDSKIFPLSYVGIAPDYAPGELISNLRGDRVSDLELIYNEREVKATNSIFLSYKTPSKVFLSEDATKAYFKAYADKTKILHLAMHAFDLDSTEDSHYLLFSSPNSDDTTYLLDRLYEHEIYPLALNNQLVILSACNSGKGELIEGEGIAHLGRAFRVAGASNVLTSLWELNDYAPSEIVPQFITYLHEGYTKAEALQKAREDFFNDNKKILGKVTPYYWANLILEGDINSIRLKNE